MSVARIKIVTLDGDVPIHDTHFFSFPGSGTSWSVVLNTQSEGNYTVSENHLSEELAQSWLSDHLHDGDGGVILIEIGDF